MSLRAIAEEMRRRHGLEISHTSVRSFLRTHGGVRRSFLDGIQETRKSELLGAIKAVWTHDSTAIEGNTLTLGDTMIVLKYGLTVSGKPLKDHQDVIGHANGVDRIRELLDAGTVTEADVKSLHALVIADRQADIYRPVGDWKREENGTYGESDGRSAYMPYAPVDDVPFLMRGWLAKFNASLVPELDEAAALNAYLAAHVSFVRIHPFFDGNGRMARLLANLPVLFSGHPPIVVASERRVDYIKALWDYQRKAGPVSRTSPELVPQTAELAVFREILRASWRTTLDLVAEARLSAHGSAATMNQPRHLQKAGRNWYNTRQ